MIELSSFLRRAIINGGKAVKNRGRVKSVGFCPMGFTFCKGVSDEGFNA